MSPQSANDAIPDGALHVAVPLFLGDMDCAHVLEAMQSAGCDLGLVGKLDQGEASHHASGGELLSISSGGFGGHHLFRVV